MLKLMLIFFFPAACNKYAFHDATIYSVKKAKINIYTLSNFLLLLVLFFFLTSVWAKSKVSAEDRLLLTQSLAPIPGVGPTVCVSNCGGNTNPTVSGSGGGIGSFCRVESDCNSGLRCVPTFACAAGCVACNGSSVTTCQRSASSCAFKNRRCSIAQGRFCCRGLTCVNEVVNAMIVPRCKQACL